MTTPLCEYCKKPADGPMLVMGPSMAHVLCVVEQLNELLDSEWEPGLYAAQIVRIGGKQL